MTTDMLEYNEQIGEADWEAIGARGSTFIFSAASDVTAWRNSKIIFVVT